MAPDAETKKPDLGRVLVVGGCGMLGHHVVRLLLRDYAAAVSVLDLRCTANRRPDADGVTYHEGDITDAARVAAVLAEVRPETVIHTASPAPQAAGKVADALFRRVNVDGTRTVLDACRAAGVKALVYTSSASVVSDNRSDLVNADERWPVVRGKAQSEYYSETKAAAEALVLAANANPDTNTGPSPPDAPRFLTAAIRPSAIFGEGDTMLLHHLLQVHRQGRTRWQLGDNTNLFDFTYVENVAHAHLLAARALLATHARAGAPPLDHERVDGEVFFVTNDSPVYFWDLARAVWRAAGSEAAADAWVLPRGAGLVLGLLGEAAAAALRRPPTLTRQRVVYACMTRYYNIAKAKRRLGYRPLVPLDEAVRQSVRWTLAHEAEGEAARALKKGQ
ncbi:hypothetical protein P8C59_003968 [Phyllachora maydis]|uniref:Sterol-4-alpha-carboxylate 3-dehydrogenase ERG26, decarboxylating n=1 Tax=Phyllachora maydis TaxID=1825666 RepID=A0AAD9I325_9PEZI|nr:hypothetical protein P8C59_003968 [Phyllachora maydis]